MRQVPELKLQDYKSGDSAKVKAFQESLYGGLKEYGFIVLTGHGISEDFLDRSYELLKKLFSLSPESKKRYSMPDQGFQRGYTPYGVEHAKDSNVADLKEFWHVGRESYEGLDNFWPEELESEKFKDHFTSLYNNLDEIGLTLLEALTGPLELDSNYFSQRVSKGNSILRLLHYPKLEQAVPKGALRAAPHEDINLITILVAATESGLQLKDRDGSWLDVQAPKNSLIVDAGDMLSRITNEVIPSTTHQVINPSGENKERYSMPFFMHPNSDATLECIDSCRGEGEKYQSILADDFLKQRLREIGLKA